MGWVKDKGASASKKYEQGGKIGAKPNIIGPDPVRWMDDSPDFMEEGGSVDEKKELSQREKKRKIKKIFKTKVSIEDTKRKDVQEHYGTEGDTRATRKALKKHKKEKRKRYLDTIKDKNKTLTFGKNDSIITSEKRKKK